MTWRKRDGAEAVRAEVELSAGMRTFVLDPTSNRRRPAPSVVRARRTVREAQPLVIEDVSLERQAVVRERWTEALNPGDCAATWTPFESFELPPQGAIVFDVLPDRFSILDLVQVAVSTASTGERRAVLGLASLGAERRVVVPVPLSTRDEPPSGVVVDARGAPVFDAELLLEERYWNFSFDFEAPSMLRLAHATSDSLGRFSLPYPPAPGRRIVASAPGFFLESTTAARALPPQNSPRVPLASASKAPLRRPST